MIFERYRIGPAPNPRTLENGVMPEQAIQTFNTAHFGRRLVPYTKIESSQASLEQILDKLSITVNSHEQIRCLLEVNLYPEVVKGLEVDPQEVLCMKSFGVGYIPDGITINLEQTLDHNGLRRARIEFDVYEQLQAHELQIERLSFVRAIPDGFWNHLA